MPKLKPAKIERFFLPSTEGAEKDEDKAFVDLDITKLRPIDVMDLDQGSSDALAGVTLLANRIKGWNWTNEEGQPLEITLESVKLLDFDDIFFLSDQIPNSERVLDEAQKKI